MGILTAINPATEEIYGMLEECTDDEIDAIISKANKDKSWANSDIKERVRIVEKLVPLLEKYKESIALTMAHEIGKPLKAGRHEIEITKKRIEAYCSQIPGFIADEVIFEDENEKNIVRYEPLGTAAVISPWNAPVFVALASIIPPLLCGNNVIFKPSEYSSFTGLRINELFEQLRKEGMPTHAFQIVIGGKSIGKKLVESSIDFVALTGSIMAGKDVIKASADKLHRYVLELGGKDPAIVLEDADIEKAAREIVKSAVMYTGQVCFGVERCYVHDSIFDVFVQYCTEEIKKIRVANPLDENTDIGPISVKFQFEKVKEHIQDAVGKGATIVYGCERMGNKGYFIQPGILTNINHEMKIMREETFGPVLPIMSFDLIDRAVQLANDSIYGLTASIWTSDIKKGEEIAKHIEAGTVEINRHGMSKAGCPWGGFKQSGIGRIYSREGTMAMTNIKHVWVVKN